MRTVFAQVLDVAYVALEAEDTVILSEVDVNP